MTECSKCGNDIKVNPVEEPSIDWVKVVCSDCGNVVEISTIRVNEAAQES